MAIAQGPGRRIDGGGLAISAPYARVYAQVQPILVDATGAPVPNPGTFDSNGQYLHFRYWGNLNLGARSGGDQDPSQLDFVPNRVVVDFDADSEFTLPFEGFLELIGGQGQYKFGMFVKDYVDARYYKPQLRTLRSFQRAGQAFTIPDFHTFILGSNSASQFILPTLDVLEPSTVLPGSNILAGSRITMVKDTTVITGWRG